MSSRRGLVSASSRRNADASSSSNRPNRPAGELPPYEPPSCPLNEAGRQALRDISRSRDFDRYEWHLDHSITMIKESVSTINDRLWERRAIAQAAAAKHKDGGDKSESQEAAESAVAAMEERVASLTAQSEAALREVLDLQVELQDDKAVFGGLPDQLAALQAVAGGRNGRQAKRRRRNNDQEDGEDEENGDAEGVDEDDEIYPPAPATNIREQLKQGREAKAAEYSALGSYEKYGRNNEYITFKKTWHDAVHHTDEIPLADATTWFDQDGNPRMVIKRDRGAHGRNGHTEEEGEENNDDDDDDVVVSREVISYECPLTLVTMKEPYRSNLCKHTFEKAAIVEMLRRSAVGSIKCPMPGCNINVR